MKTQDYLLETETLLEDGFLTSRFKRAMISRPGTDDIKMKETGETHLIWAYRKNPTTLVELHDDRGGITLDLSKSYAQMNQTAPFVQETRLYLADFGVDGYEQYHAVQVDGETVMGVQWTIGAADISMAIRAPGREWIGFGFAAAPNTMAGADAVITWWDAYSMAYNLGDQRGGVRSSGEFVKKPRSYLLESRAEYEDGWITARFRRAFDTRDRADVYIDERAKLDIIWALAPLRRVCDTAGGSCTGSSDCESAAVCRRGQCSCVPMFPKHEQKGGMTLDLTEGNAVYGFEPTKVHF
jgi:hypothetical protein